MDLHVTLAGAPPTAFAAREIVVDTAVLPTGAALAQRLEADGFGGPFTVDGAPLATLVVVADELAQGAVIVCGAQPAPWPQKLLPHLVLVVHTGPDAGQVIPLARGSHTIGRSACGVVLYDPAVSRRHAVLTVTADRILLEDLQSANGTFVDGRPITSAELTVESTVRIGDSRCAIRLLHAAGWDAVDPAAVLAPLDVGSDPPARPPRVLVLTAVLPLVLGIVLALTTGMWFFLAFSALSATTGLVPLLTYRQRVASFGAAVQDAVERDRLRRLAAAPDPGECGLAAVRTARGSPRAGHAAPAGSGHGTVLVRLGTADQPANLMVHRNDVPFSAPVVAGVPLLVPCGGNPSGRRTFRISGDAEALHGVLRAVLLQLAHPSGPSPDVVCWGPTHQLPLPARFLPNVRLTRDPSIVVGLARQSSLLLVLQLSEDMPDLSDLTNVFVFVFVFRFVLPAGTEPGARGPSRGPRVEESAAELHDGMTLHGRQASARIGGLEVVVAPEQVSARTFERMARSLGRAAAPGRSIDTRARRPAGAAAAPLPRSASLWSGDLTPNSLGDSATARWTGSDGSRAAAPLGRSAHGALSIDLVRDGPHLLVAGTTGSGKSEFLRTLVLGLALEQPPRHLTVLLIDYKGGSGLGPLVSLPHCVGSLTDISSESTGRALASLRAELRRRELLCAEHGAHDLGELRHRASDSCPPRLVVVVDEFRMLSDAVPTAMPDLMKIAALGRSLGVHLVLATQRAQGVVTPDLRANITSSVLLRVQTPVESQDLLGTSGAAAIAVDTPGRAFLRRGSEDPLPFQVASSSRLPPTGGPPGWRDLAEYLGEGATTDHLPPPPDRTEGTASPPGSADLLGQAVASIRRAVGSPDPARLHRPVLPPLPARLAATAWRNFSPVDGPPERPPSARSVGLGVADYPERQDQRALLWQPGAHSHLALVGLPGSGVTEAVASLVASLPAADPDAHLYLLDGDGSLAGSAHRAQVGAYVRADETKRAGRVLERLAGLGPRAPEQGPDGGPGHDVVLVITGWGRWSSQFRHGRSGRAEEDLHAVVRDGATAGVTVLLSGDRELTAVRFFALLPNRVYLPLGAQAETTLTWPRMPAMDGIAGRGFAQGRITGTSGEGICQLLLDPPTPARPVRSPSTAPFPVLALPRTLTLEQLFDDESAAAGPPTRLLLGVAGDDLHPYGVSLRAGEVYPVLGHDGSGRTNTLRVLSASARRRSPAPAVLAPPDGTPRNEAMDYWRRLDERTVSLPPPSGRLLLVDDAEDLPDDVVQVLTRLVRHGAAAVVTAAPGLSLISRVPLAAQSRGTGRGLILSPRTPADGDFLGVRLAPEGPRIPGRGTVCESSGLVEIQIAHVREDRNPDEDGPPAPRGDLQRFSAPRRPDREIDDRFREQHHDHGGRRHDE